MTTHASDIFHRATELDLDELSFCKADVKSLQEWAGNLPILQLGDSSKALFSALLEISALNCSETLRFQLIQVLHPTLENVLISLEKHFFEQGVVTSDRHDQVVELAMWLRCHFAKIYIDISIRSHHQLQQKYFSFFAFKQKKSTNITRILSSYYALQQLTLLFYQQHLIYSSPMQGQWAIAHRLMNWAIKNNYYQNNVNQIQGTNHKLRTISDAYAQLILLEILNTHQIRPSEIQGLYSCSFNWARLIQIYPRETQNSRYAIDSKKDEPPTFFKSLNERQSRDIFINTQQLLEHFTQLQSKQAGYLSTNEKIFLTPALHFHIHHLLTNTVGRRSERYEYSAPLTICFTLSVAHFYLSKGKTFRETLELDSSYQLQSESGFMAAAGNNNNQIKTNSAFKPIDREARRFYSAEVINISLTGYKVKWTDVAARYLKTGELILVQESQQPQWRCATIRWIKQSAEKNLELGIEILAQNMYPCSVHIRNDRNLSNYHVALLVENNQLDIIQNSIIITGLPIFREKQSIFLRLGTHEIRIYLTKALLITQSFMQFEYELLDEDQHRIVEDFMSKKMNEIRNQELWDALK